MKRFYKIVATARKPEGFEILLDGKPVKTPLKNKLVAPIESLANGVMQEWAAQEKEIKPETMGLTQILTTAIDHVSNERAAYEQAVMRYVDTDLLCYQAEEPEDLVAMQKQAWDGPLAKMEQLVGIKPQVTHGLRALEQPQAYKKAIEDIVKLTSDLELTVLQLVVSLSGSVVLGVLMHKGQLSAQQAYDAVMLEENYKAQIYDEEKYGAAPFQERARLLLRNDLDSAEKFLGLIR